MEPALDEGLDDGVAREEERGSHRPHVHNRHLLGHGPRADRSLGASVEKDAVVDRRDAEGEREGGGQRVWRRVEHQPSFAQVDRSEQPRCAGLEPPFLEEEVREPDSNGRGEEDDVGGVDALELAVKLQLEKRHACGVDAHDGAVDDLVLVDDKQAWDEERGEHDGHQDAGDVLQRHRERIELEVQEHEGADDEPEDRERRRPDEREVVVKLAVVVEPHPEHRAGGSKRDHVVGHSEGDANAA
mmetsp:Transcript_24839/g.59000  ORF Transcript_24839/g.59000 Transcript_24839/m.59000 type:complete len:243 (-) Transcript_24839:926-1654(-)